MGRDDILTPRVVEGLIADGKTILIFEDYVLNLSAWLSKHPGGQLAIQHMVGRDATDEIKVYHSDASLAKMKAFRIGRKPVGVWPNMTPPIRGGVYRRLDSTALAQEAVDTDVVSSDTDSSHDGDDLLPTPSRDQDSLVSAISSDCSDEESPEAVKTADKASGLRQRTAAASSDKPADAPLRRLSPTEYTEWAIGEGKDRDRSQYPPVDAKVQEEIAQKYRELHQKVRDGGYYECPYLDYGKECARYAALFTTFLVLLRYEWYLTSALFLGLFWHQIMFTAHDAGHCAITHIFVVDTLIAIFIADFCCGLSMGWWKSSHNVHHLITNQPEHDPDIQNLPLFATCPSFFKNVTSTYYNGFVFYWDKAAEILVPYQKYTFYPVMGIARFNLYLLSWLHILSSKSAGLYTTTCWWIRPTEIVFMCCYWYIFGYRLLWCTLPTWPIRVAFTLISHIVLMPLHVQITLSHWGMSTTNLGEDESFPQRQLRTTLDVDCPAWMDFVHGGLQFQAVHHLFPRVPRHNLRKVQALVREFCRDTAIPYSILTFLDSNKKVIGRLSDIGDQVTMLVNCHNYMVETGESGLH